MKDDQDLLKVLRNIQTNPKSSQRAMSKNGLVKAKNFSKNKNKKNYLYILTPKGISEKTKLTINFMNRKMKEYDELKRELEENVDSSKD